MAPREGRGWRLRPVRAGDEAAISAILERGFGRRFEEREWRWKYRECPLFEEVPDATRNWVATDPEGEVIFHYGGVPRRLCLGGSPVPAMVGSDASADPGVRRRGMFSAGLAASHEAWQGAGYQCILGPPNEQWGSRIQAFDWRPMFRLRWQIRPIRPERLLAKRTGLPVLGRFTVLGKVAARVWDGGREPDVEVAEIGEATDEMAAVWRDCLADGKIGLDRDVPWLHWRFFACPRYRCRALVARRDGRVAGYLIYRQDAEHRYGFILELLTRPADTGARRALLRATVERLAAGGADAVASLAIPGSEIYRSQRRAGFVLSWGEFVVRCVPLADDLPMDLMRLADRWWMCGADFDII